MLADANYTVSGEDPGVHFRVKAGSLHLVLDVTIGSAYNLTLTWNKHMAVFIKVARASQVPLPALRPGVVGSPARRHLTPAPAGSPLRPVWQLQWEYEGRLPDTQQVLSVQRAGVRELLEGEPAVRRHHLRAGPL